MKFFISNLIIDTHDILYVYFKRVWLSLKGLSNGEVVSPTEKEYGSEVYFL